MKSNLNLIKLYNTMKTLGSNTYYLPLTIEGCNVGVYLSMNSIDFKLSFEGKDFKLAFAAEKMANHISFYHGGLKDISHRDRLLGLTDPGKSGKNTQVFMQRGVNHYTGNFTQAESSIVSRTDGPSNLSRGTKRTLEDTYKGASTDNDLGVINSNDVKVTFEGHRAYLAFDINKLKPDVTTK
jgi:hypothetical protein